MFDASLIDPCTRPCCSPTPSPCPAPRCSTGGQAQLRRRARSAHLDRQQRGRPSGAQFKSGTQPSTADGTQELLLRAEAKKKASGGRRRGAHGAGATTQKPARGARRTPQGGGSGQEGVRRKETRGREQAQTPPPARSAPSRTNNADRRHVRRGATHGDRSVHTHRPPTQPPEARGQKAQEKKSPRRDVAGQLHQQDGRHPKEAITRRTAHAATMREGRDAPVARSRLTTGGPPLRIRGRTCCQTYRDQRRHRCISDS